MNSSCRDQTYLLGGNETAISSAVKAANFSEGVRRWCSCVSVLRLRLLRYTGVFLVIQKKKILQ